jgi:uncharacterized protein (UPF0332 family)
MVDIAVQAFLTKAGSSLLGAESELGVRRYNNAANRAYYGAFQAASAALWAEGIRPSEGRDGTLSHQSVRAEWAGRLVYRRKLYGSELRSVLEVLWASRVRADYSRHDVTERQARRAALLCRQLITAVANRIGQPDPDIV